MPEPHRKATRLRVSQHTESIALGGDERAPPSRWRAILGRGRTQAFAIFLLLLAVYLINGDILPGQDATPNVRLAAKLVAKHSLVFTPEEDPFMFAWSLQTATGKKTAVFPSWTSTVEGETTLQAYRRGALGTPKPLYYLMKTRFPGLYTTKYGPGTGLFAVPFLAAVYPFAHDLYERRPASVLWLTAKVAAACAVAGSAAFLFLAALAFMRPGSAAGLALAFGLGTSAWSSSSQTLWQHGPTGFFLALGTWLLLAKGLPAGKTSRSVAWVGLAYACALACRPTAALAMIAVGAYFLWCDRRAFLALVLGAAPILILLSSYNLYYFGRPLVLGQVASVGAIVGMPAVSTVALSQSNSLTFATSFLRGLAGIVASPSRGLLVFSPVAGFAFWGLIRAWRNPELSKLRPVSIAALAMVILVARWHGWWGGWSYGYRLLSEEVTLLAFLAIPVVEQIRRHRILLVGFALAAAWSVAVQFVGAFAYDVVGWNNRPVFAVRIPGRSEPLLIPDANQARNEADRYGGSMTPIEGNVDLKGHARVWSVTDNQIIYYIEHFGAARQTKQTAIARFLQQNG
jgi:hypothetical protein